MDRILILIISIFALWLFISFTKKKTEKKTTSKADTSKANNAADDRAEIIGNAVNRTHGGMTGSF